jgi:hypothetical protein
MKAIGAAFSQRAQLLQITHMMTSMAFITIMMTMTAINISIVVPCSMMMTMMMILLLLVDIISHQPGERVQK